MARVNHYDITSLELDCTCVGISQARWNQLMEGNVKANGASIRRLIKKHIPELHDQLALKYPNPYEWACKRTKTHFIYRHSGIEYFLKFQK
jgi:hypothetical protein